MSSEPTIETPIIETHGLTRTFRVRDGLTRRTVVAVEDLTLRVDAGEAVGYIGANGAGKSTTIKMLTGIVEVGLFCHMAKAAYFGNQDGSVTIKWHDGRVEQVEKAASPVIGK